MNRRNFFQKLLPTNWRTGNYSDFLNLTKDEENIVQCNIKKYTITVKYQLLKDFTKEDMETVVIKMQNLDYKDLIVFFKSGYMILECDWYFTELSTVTEYLRILIQDVQNNIDNVKLNAINIEIN